MTGSPSCQRGATSPSEGPDPLPDLAFAAAGLALSAFFVPDTALFVALESSGITSKPAPSLLTQTFDKISWRQPHLFGVSQAGFVNNLNDGLAWGIFPLFFVSRGLDLDRVAILAAAYPLVWGALQLGTGWASDLIGRKHIIVGGMLLQAVAIALVGARVHSAAGWRRSSYSALARH